MSLTESDLDHVLKLSHLEIPDSEKQAYLTQLQHILTHMEGINNLDLSQVSDSAWTEGQSTPERADEIHNRQLPTLSDFSPHVDDNTFVVPKIVGDIS